MYALKLASFIFQKMTFSKQNFKKHKLK